MAKHTAAQIIAAIEGSKGIKSVICAKVPCAYKTLMHYMSKHPTVAAAYAEARISLIGDSASVVAGNIERSRRAQKDDPTAQVDSSDAKWVLSRMGRSEGWGVDDPTINVNVGITLSDWKKKSNARRKQVEDIDG